MTPRMSTESSTPGWAEDCVAPPIRVVVVDDHQMLRASIRVILAAEADMEWVGEASDGAGDRQLPVVDTGRGTHHEH